MIKIKDRLIAKLNICINCEKYYQKGVSLYLQGSYQRAIQVFRIIGEQGNQFEQDCYIYLAECYQNVGNIRLAAKSMENLFTFEQSAELSYSISQRYQQIGDNNLQLQWRCQTIKIDPSYIKCYLRGSTILKHNQKWNESIDMLDKALQLFPQIDQILIQKGETCETICQFQKASSCYKVLIERNPLNPLFYLAYGQNLLKDISKSNEHEEACKYLQQGLKIAIQRRDQFYCQLGLFQLNCWKRDYLSYLGKALQINPYNHAAHIGLIKGYRLRQQYEEGINYMLKYLQKHPNCQETKIWLALFYQLADHVDLCNNIIAQFENKIIINREIYFMLGKIYQLKHYQQQAINCFLKHLQTSRFVYQKWQSIFQISLQMSKKGLFAKSLEYLQMLKQFGLQYIQFDKNRALVYSYLKRHQQSSKIIQQIYPRIDFKEKNNIAYFCQILYCLEKNTQCIEYFHKQISPIIQTMAIDDQRDCMMYFLQSSMSLKKDNEQIRAIYQKFSKLLKPYKITYQSFSNIHTLMKVSIHLKDYPTSDITIDLIEKCVASKDLKRSIFYRIKNNNLAKFKEQVQMGKQQAATPA